MRHTIHHKLLTIVCVMLSVWAVSGQSLTTLRGVVVDEQSAILPGATVTLKALDGTEKTVVCDSKGEFLLPDLQPGMYTLIVAFDGFETYLDNAQQVPQLLSLKIALKIAAVNIETEVKADDGGLSMEPDQSLSAIVLDEKFIETASKAIPSLKLLHEEYVAVKLSQEQLQLRLNGPRSQ